MKKDEENDFINEISGMELDTLFDGLNQISDFLFEPIKNRDLQRAAFVYETNKSPRFNKYF